MPAGRRRSSHRPAFRRSRTARCSADRARQGSSSPPRCFRCAPRPHRRPLPPTWWRRPPSLPFPTGRRRAARRRSPPAPRFAPGVLGRRARERLRRAPVRALRDAIPRRPRSPSRRARPPPGTPRTPWPLRGRRIRARRNWARRRSPIPPIPRGTGRIPRRPWRTPTRRRRLRRPMRSRTPPGCTCHRRRRSTPP